MSVMQVLWPRMMMKKWLNRKSTGDEFSADEYSADERDDSDLENESENDCQPEGILCCRDVSCIFHVHFQVVLSHAEGMPTDFQPRVPKRHTTRNFSPSKLKKDGRDGECFFY